MASDPLTAAARFDAAAAHPAHASAMAHQPTVETTGAIMVAGVVVLFAFLFALVSLAFVGGGAPLMFALAWFAGCTAFMAAALAGVKRAVSYHRAPIERAIAVVVHERTDVSGGGNDHSVNTSYHVTLQFRDGIRREYDCPGDLLGRAIRGDIGVAYLKSRTLVDFRRFDV